MSLFQSVLVKITKKFSEEELQSEAVQKVVESILGMTLPPQSVRCIGAKLVVTANPTIKMAIRFKQEELLSALKKNNYNITIVQ